ncbi:MAG: regulatory iron-sulfur-containing complex subunit RicT [Desulfuromonadales bacterium]|nr:regulatory iron-sulfur-containing complex subunit RicT [Desulfuromonadales bacterium]MDW7758259.1 regulatory iron-sulfur-containing complex subunit RicT [Desulfuromonadales bacterium]
MIRITSVKFRTAGKQYDFNSQDLPLEANMRVVVETDRGRALGTVVQAPREIDEKEAAKELKNIIRIATDEDLALAAANADREREAFRICAARIGERKMEMKLVRAEYLFDGSKIIFYFTADGRVDFRELVKDLAHHFHTRIEMRQIGVRDEAKLIGGLGICGRELCCCTFLTDFAPVSVRMAKEQGLALNPSKISGQCGRLLCCLGYEFETYCSLRKQLPKCGRKIQVDGQEGEVIGQDILAQKVTIRLGDGQTRQATVDELNQAEKSGTLPSPPPAKEGKRPEGSRRDSSRNRKPRPAGENKPSQPRPEGRKPQAAEAAKPAGDEGAASPRKRRRGRRRPKKK